MVARDSLVVCATLGVLVGVMACSERPPATDHLERIRASIPSEIDGWRKDGAGEVFDRESIFSYIDGHAEVYLAYGMRRCFAIRFVAPEGEGDIVLDLFELASSADAFGAFTNDQDGDAVEIGRAGLFRFGWLSFWQGSWFGSVYSERESERARAAVIALGRKVAQAIDDRDGTPDQVTSLPTAGLVPRSVRYLHRHELLQGFAPVGADNLFHLGSDVDLALGRYERNGAAAVLMIADYPSCDAAERAVADVNGGHAGDGSLIVARRVGARVVAVVGATSAEIAESLLEEGMGADHE